MKKIFFPGVFLALLLIFSCSKDEFTEEDATQAQKDVIHYQDSIDQVRDSLRMVGGIIQYSVSVIPIDGSSGFVGGGSYKSANDLEMLSGAKVSVAQHGVILSDSTDDTGIAVFHNLRVGTVNVSVQVEGYTNINFIAEIDHDPSSMYGDSVYYQLFHAATMVPVFSLTEGTSTISGKVTYEGDLTNLEEEVAEGATVIAMLDIDDTDFKQSYFYGLWNSALSDLHGVITQAAYSDLINSDVTDTEGMYDITMPSSADGLPIMMEVADMVADQSLLMNTVHSETPDAPLQNIRTIFSTQTTNPSNIPNVPSAYVEFSAPTGVITQQPVEHARAEAIIGESGIASIAIINQGNGYTQAPHIEITTNGNGTGAEAVAYITDGKVTSIEIIEAGTGYHQDDVINVIATSKIGANASAEAIVTYSVTSFSNSSGDGYTSVPEIAIQSNSGSGASGTAVLAGYVDDITITEMGSGYTCYPDIMIEGSTDDNGLNSGAEATAIMTEYNPIHSIELSENWLENNFFETTPQVTIETNGTGSGATAVVQLSTEGRIERVELTNAGLAYTEAPTINISGDGQGAAAWAWLNPDGSINIELEEGGMGYSSATITISAPPAGGTQATANAILAFPVDQIVLTNPGSGYDINVNASNNSVSNEPTIRFDGNSIGSGNYIVWPSMKVEGINITDNGDYYRFEDGAPAITITPSCGYGSGAIANVTMSYYVERIDVLTPGSGYEYGADINVTVITPPEGCDEQATASANLGDGALTGYILEDGGENYFAPPHVTLTGSSNGSNDQDAEIEAILSNGSIIGFTIVDGGEGYPHSTNYGISISTFVNPANLTAQANTTSGKISFVEISDPGAGYTTEPLVRFIRYNDDGDEISDEGYTAAEAEVVLVDGRVTAINITNPGTGYYIEPDVDIYVPDYLEVAEGYCYINDDGYITGVNITDGGMGYSTAPTVEFFASVPGQGTGAAATAVIKDGEVVNVIMSNNGTGYTGKNYAAGTAGIGVSFKPTGSVLNSFEVYAGKAYIRDIYLGTGYRTIED